MRDNASPMPHLRTFVAGLVLLSHVAGAQGITGNKQGQGGSVVQGAAGTQGSKGDNGLEHCDKPMGAMAVVEPQSQILGPHIAAPVVPS